MRFYITVVGSSGDSMAVLNIHYEGEWIPLDLSSADRMKGFRIRKLHDLTVIDETGSGFRFIPPTPPKPPAWKRLMPWLLKPFS